MIIWANKGRPKAVRKRGGKEIKIQRKKKGSSNRIERKL
jgi:hypothetical protein